MKLRLLYDTLILSHKWTFKHGDTLHQTLVSPLQIVLFQWVLQRVYTDLLFAKISSSFDFKRRCLSFDLPISYLIVSSLKYFMLDFPSISYLCQRNTFKGIISTQQNSSLLNDRLTVQVRVIRVYRNFSMLVPASKKRLHADANRDHWSQDNHRLNKLYIIKSYSALLTIFLGYV